MALRSGKRKLIATVLNPMKNVVALTRKPNKPKQSDAQPKPNFAKLSRNSKKPNKLLVKPKHFDSETEKPKRN